MAKRVCVDGEDRISELPVHIIHHILCRTDLDVEEAAISCMLSKRWYYCWTSRPNLIFNQFQGYKYRPLENYVKLVDQSLRSHVEKNLHLEQFILTYNGQEVDPHVDTWIELAVKLNVTELGIHRFGLTSYNLPDVIYDAKKLTTLQLSRYTEPTEQGNLHPCQIAILDGYNTLQTLKLTGATITDQQFRDVSYKFPNISELDLARCYKLKNIEIQSEKLKKFTLLEELNSLEKITIQAPNLLKFDFHGSKMPFTYMDTSSLESARLNFFLPGTNFGSVDSSW
ncbi:putative F-box/LRR-repeat protein At5g02930 [Solanum tuberosum]|nr:PREDICTED: putative F-box/LRR-repeat protein At5g02930 [Solanum tuberosum]